MAFGALGRPLLGQRELAVGAVGWDVSALEFKLVRYGLSPKAVDGRFTAATATALARFQKRSGLSADGIAGKQTYRSLAGHRVGAVTPRVRATHAVAAGESFFSIAHRYGISPLLLAKQNRLKLAAVIIPGQKLTLPAAALGAQPGAVGISASTAASREAVRMSIDRWSAEYGVDPGSLAQRPGWSRVFRRASSRESELSA